MEKAATRMELLRDAGLRTAIGSAIKDKRMAIYSEVLKSDAEGNGHGEHHQAGPA
jgi:hypothetical protein